MAAVTRAEGERRVNGERDGVVVRMSTFVRVGDDEIDVRTSDAARDLVRDPWQNEGRLLIWNVERRGEHHVGVEPAGPERRFDLGATNLRRLRR